MDAAAPGCDYDGSIVSMSSILRQGAQYVGAGLEATGVLVIAAGAIYSALSVIALYRGAAPVQPYQCFRRRLGYSILLGLEFLVAGDIIRTVAVEPTYKSVTILAAIVLIRTFLSFALEVEMSGRWPWQRERAEQSD